MLKRTKHLLRSIRRRLLPSGGVSSSYVKIDSIDAKAEGERLRGSWQDGELPVRQRILADQQLAQYRAGAAIKVFDSFVRSIRELPARSPNRTLLEIGCSSGYYSEVCAIAKLPVVYSGCDYSRSFIELARSKHPEYMFSVQDATSLDFTDSSFDIVVSGCCLLHIPDYSRAVAESVRVSSEFVIFHRTPVVWGDAERWYRKQAYGVETVEIHFNELEFLALLRTSGLELVTVHTLDEQYEAFDGSKGSASRTYVCKKRSISHDMSSALVAS